MYSKKCLWLRGQEMHLGGNWNVGRLKGGDQYCFFFVYFFGRSSEMTFIRLATCARMHKAPEHASRMKSGNVHNGVWHTLRFRRKDLAQAVYRPSTRRLEPSDPRFHECGSLKEESDREVYGRVGVGEWMRERLLLDLITVKHWTLIGDIKTFYESSCSNLQHYNSVPVQNKSAAAL